MDALSASQEPARATKALGVTDVVPLHHQVYPRLRNRLSLRDRPDRSAVRAEARPERTGRNVAFGCCRCRRAALARPNRPSHRARPHHSLLAAPLGRSRRRVGVCHRAVCLHIRWARRLVLLGPRCRCPALAVSLERAIEVSRGAFGMGHAHSGLEAATASSRVETLPMFVRSRASRTRAERPIPGDRVLDAFDRALIGAHGAALDLVAAYLSRPQDRQNRIKRCGVRARQLDYLHVMIWLLVAV